jgi:hypothetical protein
MGAYFVVEIEAEAFVVHRLLRIKYIDILRIKYINILIFKFHISLIVNNFIFKLLC